ncbi:MAG: methionyl-tRNA formyltransferase, partial [Clostridiales bacterium]|nr:methionyl-tRNA formyltransferase [Clostridiales bacterium]
MKIIFMGTPDFAAGILEAVVAAGHEVLLVVTQPDKPKGRGGKMQFPPVKEKALAQGLKVYQPKRIRDPECVEYLRGYSADVIVVAAFGQILPQEILDLPRICCMNIHASLLPRYRGASPIQWTIINGDDVTGVTAMRMDAGLDTGDIIASKEVTVAAGETAGSLFDRLSSAGAQLTAEVLARMEAGEEIACTPQDASQATHT